jgi:hypothetical protein
MKINLQKSAFCLYCRRLFFSVLLLTLIANQTLPAQSNMPNQQSGGYPEAMIQELSFEQNQGQHDPSVHFLAKDRQATYFFMPGEVRSVVQHSADEAPFAYTMKFVGAQAGARPIGIGRADNMGRYHVLEGSSFIKDVPQHKQLRYPNVWDNVHVYFGQSEEGLKYDFVVNPGGDPSQISFDLEGVTDVRITPEGELAFNTPFGELRKGRPYTYQDTEHGQIEVPSAYVVNGKRVSFTVGSYDVSRKLVIDPVALKWATVLGGADDFHVRASYFSQETGHLYMTGEERGAVFPNTTGILGYVASPPQAFVMCMKADGSEILWKTSIRTGNIYSAGRGLTVDAAGQVYIYTVTSGGSNHPYQGISPQVAGPLVTLSPGNINLQGRALFKLSAGGDELKYFTFLMNNTLPGLAPADHYNGGIQPVLIDAQGRVVIPVAHSRWWTDNTPYPQNIFSPRGANVFGVTNPITTQYTNILTLDTEVPGEAGIVESSLVDFRLRAAGKDAGGNLYFSGVQGRLMGINGDRLFEDFFHPAYFTHMVFDTAAIHNYLRNFGCCGKAANVLNHALFKLSPDQQQILYGSYVGYEIWDYMDSVYDPGMVVSEEGDVYINNTYYLYSDIGPYRQDLARHAAPKQLIIQDWEDIYGCGGWCLGINLAEKRPAGNYQHPEWMIQYPAGGNYWPSHVAFDNERDMVHLLTKQDPFYLTPGTKPFVTDGAFQTEASSDGAYNDFSHYMQVTSAGDVAYATVTSPEYDPQVAYIVPLAGLQVNEANGDVMLIEWTSRSNFGNDNENRSQITPSYRDFATGEKVEVVGGNLIPALNNRGKTLIKVFHDAHPGQNIINDFPVGENTFCVGSLIRNGADALPLTGNRVEYKSGDGSLPEHNLPILVLDGIESDHPAPAGSVPSYQWQSSFRSAGETEFGPWLNVSGGTRFTLAPQLALAAGTIRYRRLVSIGEFNLVSNEIEAVISGNLAMSINGPTTPVYFCKDVSTDLGINVSNPGGTISWQWYAGFSPVGDDVIFPSSGSGLSPEAFTAAVAMGNTLSGYLRLLVTDDASGCQQQFFVTIQELTDRIFSKSTVTLCPGTSSVVLGPRVANPDWDYRYTSLTDMSELTGLRPEVSTPGVYRLEVSMARSGNYCAVGATEVTVLGSQGDYDAGLQVAGPFGFCETGTPAAIGPDNAPASGYAYRWTPAVGLSSTTVSNPVFNPAAAAATQGIRVINYIFEAIRESDGCVYSELVTVSDTTQAEALVPEVPIIGVSCTAGRIQLFTGGGKGRFYEWRAIATDYPGGLAALEASPDYGLGAPGQLVSNLATPLLFYPSGSGYYVDFSYKISYGIIGQTECFAEITIRATLNCGSGGGFICRPINANASYPSCSSANTLLFAQQADWSSSSWTVVSVDDVPVPAGTQPRGLFFANADNQKAGILMLGNDNPHVVVAHLEDAEWGYPGAEKVRYRFTGVIEVNGEIITCVEEINVYGSVAVEPFNLVDTLQACRVLTPGTLVGGVGVALPYTISLADYTLPALSGYDYEWRALSESQTSITNSNSLTPTLSPTLNTQYELRLTDPSNGCSFADTLTFAVSTISVNAGADLTACPGAIVQVGTNQVNGFSYSWSPGAGLFFPDAGTADSTAGKPFLVMPESASGTTLTLTVTDPLIGCAATDAVVLTSSTDAPPKPDDLTITLCTGVTQEIGPANYSRTDVSFLWESSGGSDISWLSATNTRLVNVKIPVGFFGSVSYTVKAVSAGCGMSEPATYTITVPDPGIIMGSEPTVTTCLTPLTLLETNPITLLSGFIGEWIPTTGLFLDESGTVPYVSGSDLNVYVSSPSSPLNYSLRVRHSASGCAVVYRKEAVPPADAPVIDAGGTLTYCTGSEPIDIGTSFVPGSQYIWTAVGYDANPNGNAVTNPDASQGTLMLSYLSNTMINKPTFSQSAPTPGAYRYRLSVTDAGGCVISDEVLIRVPDFQLLSLPASVMQCSGIPTQLISGSTPSGYGYQWTVVSPASSQGSISDIYTPGAFFSPQTQTVYELYYFDPANGCERTQQVTVGIAPALTLAAVEPLVFCEPAADVDLTASIADYATLTGRKWYRSLYPGVETAAPVSVTVNATDVYFLESSNAFGCTDTVAVQVLLEQVSTPAINDLFTLSLLANTVNLNSITLIEPSIGGARLVWHTNPAYSAEEELESLTVGAGTYYLSEVSANGCVSSSAALTVYKRPYINALSTDLICAGSVATPITASPAGGLEEVTYRWQKSITDPATSATWVDIADSDVTTLYPGVLNEPTWYRVQVSTDGINFTALQGSNVLKIDVDTNDPPTIPLNTVSDASASPELCDGVAISGLFHTTTGASGIGEVSGLPAGVTASWQFDTIRIQGTPTESGSFSYSIQLTGGCGMATATGMIEVLEAFDPGSIDAAGETICYGGTPATIGSLSAASGGDGNFTYSWRSSTDNYTDAIDGATATTYTPPAGLTQTVTYRRYVNDGTCGSTALVSSGEWTLTVLSSPILSGPANMNKGTSEDGSGNCSVLVSWTHPTETAGACTPLVLMMSINEGTAEMVTPGGTLTQAFEPGTYDISYLLTDGRENTAEYSFTLTVMDDESPILSCAPSIEVIFDGEETITLNMSDIGTVTDNCGLVETTLTPSVVSVSQLGQVVPVMVMAEDESGNVSGCMTNVDLGGLPAGWSQNHSEIGNCDAETLYDPQTGVWTGAAINCRYGAPFTADALMFAEYQLCGDGSITAEVSGLTGALPYAGIAMRESGDAGTKKVQMMINRISNTLRREIRLTTGGQAYPMHFSSPCERTWLRIVRTGNIFRGYTSQDGVTWWYVMNVHVPMNSCIEMGLVLTNMQPNSLDFANFRNVTVTGGAQGPNLWRAGMEESLESEEELLDVNVYPNPVSGELQVDLSAFAGKSVRLSLYNMQGQALMVLNLEEITDYIHQLDLSKVPTGVYSLRVQTAGAAELSRRVVVQRP